MTLYKIIILLMITWRVFESVRRKATVSLFPSCHDFEVLKCVVSCVGPSGVGVRSKAVAHRDWLSGQLDQTLTQAAEAALL